MSDQAKAGGAPAVDMPAATGTESPPQDATRAVRDADAPMSDVQRTTLRTLCSEAGAPFDAALTTTGAARRISELQRAKDRETEAARVARGAATEALPSDVGEEDPGAALDAPGNREAVGDRSDMNIRPKG